MPAGTLDLTIDQGETYVFVVTYRDDAGALVDLTGYTARLGLRRDYDQANPDILLTEASGLALGGPFGTIVVTITGAQLNALMLDSYHYDLIVTKNGVPDALLRGEVRLRRSASR